MLDHHNNDSQHLGTRVGQALLGGLLIHGLIESSQLAAEVGTPHFTAGETEAQRSVSGARWRVKQPGSETMT